MSSFSCPPKLLYFAPQTILPISRSGVQRVVREAAEALLSCASVDFVKWDHVEGQLRYFNAFDCEAFFQKKTWRNIYKLQRFAERRRYRFIDTIPAKERDATWLVMPEIFYHLPDGKLIYRSAIAQAREHGMRTAAIFYDLIPITNAAYQVQAKVPHEIYVRDLLNVDLVLPISRYSAGELRRYELEHFGIDEKLRSSLRRSIAAVPLAEATPQSRPKDVDSSTETKDVILLLGTIEPRKQQTKVLRILRDWGNSAVRKLKVVVVGSVHHKSTEEFRELIASVPAFEYRGYLSDREIDALWNRTRFSVFAANDEGFGLPISESLSHGVPCLTANFGAMREVAAGGGCFLVDVNNDKALEEGLARLAEDDDLVRALRNEIRFRPPRTWKTYATNVLEAIEDYRARFDGPSIAAAIDAIVEEFRHTETELRWFMRTIKTVDGDIWGIGCTRGVVACDVRAFAAAVAAERCDRVALRFTGTEFHLAEYDRTSIEIFLKADVWSFESEAFYEGMVRLAREQGNLWLLPWRRLVDASAGTATAFGSSVETFQRGIQRRHLTARRESAFAAACQRDDAEPGLLLLIVISTYNRGPVVAENVRWITELIEPLGDRVRLKVVDNASTDDTADRLKRLPPHPRVEFVKNVSNVGKLGNLRICSALLEADYTWVIGDDDFITPGTIKSVMQILEDHRGLPFVFMNFAVSCRDTFEQGDNAASLIKSTPPTLNSLPRGVYPIHVIALEHDNLFTATHSIVFRTDVLSACFNLTFTDPPLASLAESVPTTKQMLETYGDANAYWLAEVGIVGNARRSGRNIALTGIVS